MEIKVAEVSAPYTPLGCLYSVPASAILLGWHKPHTISIAMENRVSVLLEYTGTSFVTIKYEVAGRSVVEWIGEEDAYEAEGVLGTVQAMLAHYELSGVTVTVSCPINIEHIVDDLATLESDLSVACAEMQRQLELSCQKYQNTL